MDSDESGNGADKSNESVVSVSDSQDPFLFPSWSQKGPFEKFDGIVESELGLNVFDIVFVEEAVKFMNLDWIGDVDFGPRQRRWQINGSVFGIGKGWIRFDFGVSCLLVDVLWDRLCVPEEMVFGVSGQIGKEVFEIFIHGEEDLQG